MPHRNLRHCICTAVLAGLVGSANAAELSSGQAALLGMWIILAPLLFVAGAAFIAAFALGPAVIRAALPASQNSIKWIIVAVLSGLQLLWVSLRARTFVGQAFDLHYTPDPLDGLLLAAWGLLLFSLLKHKTEAPTKHAP